MTVNSVRHNGGNEMAEMSRSWVLVKRPVGDDFDSGAQASGIADAGGGLRGRFWCGPSICRSTPPIGAGWPALPICRRFRSACRCGAAYWVRW